MLGQLRPQAAGCVGLRCQRVAEVAVGLHVGLEPPGQSPRGFGEAVAV